MMRKRCNLPGFYALPVTSSPVKHSDSPGKSRKSSHRDGHNYLPGYCNPAAPRSKKISPADLAAVIHCYPTQVEAIQRVADQAATA